MARRANYDERIARIKAKIAKKQSELKALRARLVECELAHQRDDNRELFDLMAEQGLTSEDVVSMLKAAASDAR